MNGSQAKDKRRLSMPWTSKMNKVLSAVLPVRLRDVYLRRVGVYNSMDEFTGH